MVLAVLCARISIRMLKVYFVTSHNYITLSPLVLIGIGMCS